MIAYELDMYRIDLMSGMSRSCVYLTLHVLDMDIIKNYNVVFIKRSDM